MVYKRKTDDGRDYWSARDLSTALGYSTWQKFNRVLNKALQEEATIRKIPIVQLEGDREVNRPQLMYNLDAIIAVGYRVNSYKITDVYAECSADYDPQSETTQLFFKMVQNMMHWAITQQTAAEIIYNRADAEQPHISFG